MNSPLFIVGWAAVGAVLGVAVRWLSVKLARLEDLKPGRQRWQVLGPPLLATLLFALAALKVGSVDVLLIKSLWMLVLVQVIFFDFEHRLILDRVLVPAMLAAIVLSLFTPQLGPHWEGRLKMSLVTGLVAGVLFLAIYLLGAVIFGAEALGMGDVKLAVFIGLILGLEPSFQAFLAGVLLGGLAAIALMLLRRQARGMTFAYGPYLAAGAILVLLQA